MLTSRMVMLQRHLLGQAVRFVSFSVDPAHDTPDVLAAYAARWNEKETRWVLLATNDATLADVTAGFRVATEKTRDERTPSCTRTCSSSSTAMATCAASTRASGGDAIARLVADVSQLSSGPPD